MLEQIDRRFIDLLDQGAGLDGFVQTLANREYYVPGDRAAEAMGWLTSTAHLIWSVTSNRGPYAEEMNRIRQHKDIEKGVPKVCIPQAYGALRGAFYDWRAGLLRQIEYVVAAENFDDFLGHAAGYHKAGMKNEAAVLVSAVLEDTVKKIARRHGVDPSRTLDPIIDDLIKANAFTRPEGKAVKGFTDLRNKAHHAEWDQFRIEDVGRTIEGVRALIQNHLVR